MADIFVSYAREDRDWVARFSKLLRESSGREIWWDHSILVGEQFDEAIQRALDAAACVVVVWSKGSVNSRWVKTEAREASRREILVPVIIENVIPPLEFRSLQTADLSDWRGELDHANFLELTLAVRAMIDKNVHEPQDRPDFPLSAEPGDAPEIREQRRRSETRQRSWAGAQPSRRRLYYSAAATFAAVLLVVLAVMTGVIKNMTSGLGGSTSKQEPTSALTAIPLSRALPHLTYGIWTITKAIDDDGGDWSNSALQFTHQEEAPDGLLVRGTFTWRLNNGLVGTEELTGNYVAATRVLFFRGSAVTDMPHLGGRVLAVGSYSAVVSPDERTITNGRWGVTQLKDEAGVNGHWQAFR